MNQEELKKYMIFRKEGKEHIPLFVTEVNDQYIVAAYQGQLSEFDILIKYRQRLGNKWSLIRTPKHIHWAADVLIKMHEDREKTIDFLDFLIGIWNRTRPIKNSKQRELILDKTELLNIEREEAKKFEDLGKRGEYSIKFLILLARLLMIQEKTNLESAYMFRKLLEALKEGKDIFKIISLATHR